MTATVSIKDKGPFLKKNKQKKTEFKANGFKKYLIQRHKSERQCQTQKLCCLHETRKYF